MARTATLGKTLMWHAGGMQAGELAVRAGAPAAWPAAGRTVADWTDRLGEGGSDGQTGRLWNRHMCGDGRTMDEASSLIASASRGATAGVGVQRAQRAARLGEAALGVQQRPLDLETTPRRASAHAHGSTGEARATLLHLVESKTNSAGPLSDGACSAACASPSLRTVVLFATPYVVLIAASSLDWCMCRAKSQRLIPEKSKR